MYATLFLGYTDCGGSIGSFCWGYKVKIYTLPPTPLRCLTYPTGLPVLHPSGLTTQQSHRPYDIRLRYPPQVHEDTTNSNVIDWGITSFHEDVKVKSFFKLN